MSKPELVLSNTVTFFSGRLEAVFKKAKKLGFKYLEIIPYRWTTPEQILALEKKYGVQVIGIHMPQWWQASFWQAFRKPKRLAAKLFTFLWQFYLGNGIKNPGIKIAEALVKNGRQPYLLFHSNLVGEMGDDFNQISKRFHLVIENIPGDDLTEIQKMAELIFDPGHYGKTLVNFTIPPKIVHISYTPWHMFPNLEEQKELRELCRLYPPKYMVLETNPWVSVKKGKEILEKILQDDKERRGVILEPRAKSRGDRIF